MREHDEGRDRDGPALRRVVGQQVTCCLRLENRFEDNDGFGQQEDRNQEEMHGCSAHSSTR